MVLVIVHEGGHFFTAKFFKIRVDEFGFGFPPKIFSFKKGETEYSFNMLPFGGFVKIFGEGLNEADLVEVGFLDQKENIKKTEIAQRSLISKPKYQQALVMFAGVFANFLLAWILLSISFMSGLPTSVSNSPDNFVLKDKNLVIVSVLPDSPASLAGLQTGDKIVSVGIDGNYVSEINPENLKDFILKSSNKEIEFGYLRGKESNINLVNIKPFLNKENSNPEIGIAMDQIGIAKLPLLSALYQGMKLNIAVTKGTALGLYNLIKEGIQGQGSFSSITGPVGMVGIVGNAYDFGFIYLLSFAALISINLAIINLLPFPALDGGRLLFLLIEKIKGSHIKPQIANAVNMVGFAILIVLMLLVTYHDVVRLF